MTIRRSYAPLVATAVLEVLAMAALAVVGVAVIWQILG